MKVVWCIPIEYSTRKSTMCIKYLITPWTFPIRLPTKMPCSEYHFSLRYALVSGGSNLQTSSMSGRYNSQVRGGREVGAHCLAASFLVFVIFRSPKASYVILANTQSKSSCGPWDDVEFYKKTTLNRSPRTPNILTFQVHTDLYALEGRRSSF